MLSATMPKGSMDRDRRSISNFESHGRPWCCSWCEILGIEDEIRVWYGESSTQIRW